MALTQLEKEAYARVGVNIIDLWTIELRHSTFPAPARIVQHRADVPVTLEASAPVDAGQSVLFTALAFEFEAPSVNDDADTLARARVDGVPGLLQPLIATAMDTAEPIEATLRELAFDVLNETVVQQPATFHMRVRNDRSTMISLALELGRINSANIPCPSVSYTAESNPGLQ